MTITQQSPCQPRWAQLPTRPLQGIACRRRVADLETDTATAA